MCTVRVVADVDRAAVDQLAEDAQLAGLLLERRVETRALRRRTPPRSISATEPDADEDARAAIGDDDAGQTRGRARAAASRRGR